MVFTRSNIDITTQSSLEARLNDSIILSHLVETPRSEGDTGSIRKMRRRRAATQHRESNLRHIRAVVLGQDGVGKSGTCSDISI